MSIPVALFNISPEICERLRDDDVAKESAPGCARACATSSATLLSLSEGVTPTMKGLTPMLITPVKSRSASNPVDLNV